VYHGRFGLTMVPMRMATKKPAVRWKSLQRGRQPLGRLLGWLGRPTVGGMAVIHGRASGGVANRDFDTVQAYRRWAEARPELARTLPTMRTQRGYGVLHRALTDAFFDLEDGEYRADARHYSVLPPSVHPSGFVYEWIIPPEGGFPLVEDPVAARLLPPSALSTPQVASGTQEISAPSPSWGAVRGEVVEGGDPIGLGMVPPGEIEVAIRRTLPTGPGMRHRRLFALARCLRGIPALSGATAEDLFPVVRRWWDLAYEFIRTKEWAESWADWKDAWVRVRIPAGKGQESLGVWVRATANDPLTRLSLACEWFQQQAGNRPFFLAVRTAARVIGAGKSTAARLLAVLVESGELKVISAGRYKTGMASEYRWTGVSILAGAAKAEGGKAV
jgi:hypothetical protein